MSELHSQIVKNSLLITLNNPNFGNAFGLLEARSLLKLLDSKKIESVSGLIFRSQDSKMFCGGGNLSQYADLKRRKDGIRVNRKISKALKTLTRKPIPKIALVDGDCLGGGMELISCFDQVFTTPKSQFGFWQRRMGLSFGWGGFARWSLRVNEALLKTLSLEARSFSSYEAKTHRIIDQIMPKEELLPQALAWIGKMEKLPVAPQAPLRGLRRDNERKTFEHLWMNPEHRQKLKAFTKDG